MISAIHGQVVKIGLDHLEILVGGIGLRAAATPRILGELKVGQLAQLPSALVVREDALQLYAFSNTAERDTFEIMLSVSGIGPKIALAALSVLSPGELAQAVANSDDAVLQRIPGVGKKSAQMLILKLGEKLSAWLDDSNPTLQGSQITTAVVGALMQMGFNEKAATEAVATVTKGGADSSAILRAALQQLGRKS